MRMRTGDWVDNQPIREAWEASGLSLYELTRRLGWVRIRSYAEPRETYDVSRLARRLGYRATGGTLTRTVRYDIAVAIIRALNLDPVDFGL